MDPVWSNIAAAAPKWVISSIKIAPPTHFWVQNLENPRSDQDLKKCWKFSKTMKNKKFQTCPEIIPTHLLRILGALRYLKTCFSSYFWCLTIHPIPEKSATRIPKMMKNWKNNEKYGSVQSNILMPEAPPGPQALVLVIFKLADVENRHVLYRKFQNWWIDLGFFLGYNFYIVVYGKIY